MISSRLLSLVRCPDCGGVLTGRAAALACAGCGRRFGGSDDYLDLAPATPFAETTRYVDEALHPGGAPRRVPPPLLSAGVRHAMLRKWLRLGPADTVVDLGCGTGRALVWVEDSGAYRVGVDVAPFFADEVRTTADLLVADLRRLPLADGAFTKAFALDVWEHLSREALEQVLRETARVLAPGGALFVYSHVRKNSRLASIPRAINRLARGLERLGLIDLTYERLRKSDHVNPLHDLEDLRRVVTNAGFRLAEIRYYTPVIGAFVENVIVRVAERLLRRWTAGHAPETGTTPGDTTGPTGTATVRARLQDRVKRRGLLRAVLLTVTWAMQLDVLLFGRVPSGSFFALLVKERPERAGS